MINILSKFWIEESGQGMAEYALILAFVAVVCIIALQTLGSTASNKYDHISNEVK